MEVSVTKTISVVLSPINCSPIERWYMWYASHLKRWSIEYGRLWRNELLSDYIRFCYCFFFYKGDGIDMKPNVLTYVDVGTDRRCPTTPQVQCPLNRTKAWNVPDVYRQFDFALTQSTSKIVLYKTGEFFRAELGPVEHDCDANRYERVTLMSYVKFFMLAIWSF